MELRVGTPDELIAAVPHLMGFRVSNSMVVVPIGQGLPFARVDLPSNAGECTEMVDNLMIAYGRAGAGVSSSGGGVMLIGYADDPSDVESVSRQLSESMTEAGVHVRGRLWAGEHRWADLDTGRAGPLTTEAAGRIDAEMVLGGHRMPASSREAVEEAFSGDPGPVVRELPAVAEVVERTTPARERQWAVARAEVFVQDGQALSAAEAARMLVCLESVSMRDQMAARISCETAPSWGPLWGDLTRRAPDQLVAPAATLSALSSWCEGDGARAWCALDRIPVDQRQSYPLAVIVASALQGGVHPREWDRVRSAVPEVLALRAEGSRAWGPRPDPPIASEGRPPAGPGR